MADFASGAQTMIIAQFFDEQNLVIIDAVSFGRYAI